MLSLDADVAILGSGFGGSLTALILARMGIKPVLLERGSHPRFAIGESSTPIADAVLRDLARHYDLPRLVPLAKYGTWQASYPHLVCGLKRGFSYFQHRPDQAFAPQPRHANELLVAASSDIALADTHWLRSDVDAFLVEEVQAAGIPYFDRSEFSLVAAQGGWMLAGDRLGEAVNVQAQFVIDATGDAGFLCNSLGIPIHNGGLSTSARAIFGHFAGLKPWQESLRAANANVADHPFCCDHAALHHVIDEGWMWQLRFDNDVTSAGFVLDCAEHPLDTSISIETEWQQLLQRYPSLAAQFSDARLVAPQGGLRRTPRFQRWAKQVVGTNWALLPNTAGFIDPLHSTGIAHTLCGIERLTHILKEQWESPALTGALLKYEQAVRKEIVLIDALVSGCYLTRRSFPHFAAFAMLYFAGATTYERRRFQTAASFKGWFLNADDDTFCQVVHHARARAQQLSFAGNLTESQAAEFVEEVQAALRPFNHVGLFDESAQNMYRYTAAPA